MSERWEPEDHSIWFRENFTDVRREIKFKVNSNRGWFVRDNVTIPGADINTGNVDIRGNHDF